MMVRSHIYVIATLLPLSYVITVQSSHSSHCLSTQLRDRIDGHHGNSDTEPKKPYLPGVEINQSKGENDRDSTECLGFLRKTDPRISRGSSNKLPSENCSLKRGHRVILEYGNCTRIVRPQVCYFLLFVHIYSI